MLEMSFYGMRLILDGIAGPASCIRRLDNYRYRNYTKNSRHQIQNYAETYCFHRVLLSLNAVTLSDNRLCAVLLMFLVRA